MEAKLEGKSVVAAIALIAVAATALLGLQHRSLSQVRDENARLRKEIAHLDRLRPQSELLPEPDQDSQPADSLAHEELSELLRLRAEATRLRSR